jgi:hypothetical protein
VGVEEGIKKFAVHPFRSVLTRANGDSVHVFLINAIGVLADGNDSHHTNDDDQKRHKGIFHGGRPIFTFEKAINPKTYFSHGITLCK